MRGHNKALDAEPPIASFLKPMLTGGGPVNAGVPTVQTDKLRLTYRSGCQTEDDMLTKLVARNNTVSVTPSVYLTALEHEHRFAEHEHEQERKPEQWHPPKSLTVLLSSGGITPATR